MCLGYRRPKRGREVQSYASIDTIEELVGAHMVLESDEPGAGDAHELDRDGQAGVLVVVVLLFAQDENLPVLVFV